MLLCTLAGISVPSVLAAVDRTSCSRGECTWRSRHDTRMKPCGSSHQRLTWRTFVKAHWPAVVAADFFTAEVWTMRGLVTYYTAFVIELHSRRVRVLGTTPHPDEAFVMQTMRPLTGGHAGILGEGRILICDRDPKWSRGAEQLLTMAGVRVVRTPAGVPNCNAHAERLVRSIKEECLNRIVPLGEWHLRRALTEFVRHYHHERNHQGLANELIEGLPARPTRGPVRRVSDWAEFSRTTIGQPRLCVA